MQAQIFCAHKTRADIFTVTQILFTPLHGSTIAQPQRCVKKKLWDLTQSRLLSSTPWAYRNLKIIFIAPKYGSNSSKIHLRSTRSLFRIEVSRTIKHILKLNFPQHVYSSLQAPKSLSLEANNHVRTLPHCTELSTRQKATWQHVSNLVESVEKDDRGANLFLRFFSFFECRPCSEMRLSLKKFHEKCAGKGDSFGYWYLLDKIFCLIYPAPIAFGSKLRSRVGSVYSTFFYFFGKLKHDSGL